MLNNYCTEELSQLGCQCNGPFSHLHCNQFSRKETLCIYKKGLSKKQTTLNDLAENRNKKISIDTKYGTNKEWRKSCDHLSKYNNDQGRRCLCWHWTTQERKAYQHTVNGSISSNVVHYWFIISSYMCIIICLINISWK